MKRKRVCDFDESTIEGCAERDAYFASCVSRDKRVDAMRSIEEYLEYVGVSSVDDLSMEQMYLWCTVSGFEPEIEGHLNTDFFDKDGDRAAEKNPKLVAWLRRALVEGYKCLSLWDFSAHSLDGESGWSIEYKDSSGEWHQDDVDYDCVLFHTFDEIELPPLEGLDFLLSKE